MQKYIGQIVEIIYMDRIGRITQRVVEVRLVSGGVIKAHCLTQNAPRIFRIENILAAQPVKRHA